MTPRITPMRGARVRLNAYGKSVAPAHSDREGIIWGENRERTSWRIKFPGLKELCGLHKSFIEIIATQQETPMTDFPKLADLKPGDVLRADGGFTCLSDGAVREVMKDDDGLYVQCSEGKHHLDGQEGANGECVGLWRV
jgi:hypothetical protein